ncbi:MAG: hypothetical protein JO115_09405 [Pseudonocardiales bacterium]|nr:hypothetical protein [Pseudonocardiales bacterium]
MRDTARSVITLAGIVHCQWVRPPYHCRRQFPINFADLDGPGEQDPARLRHHGRAGALTPTNGYNPLDQQLRACLHHPS